MLDKIHILTGYLKHLLTAGNAHGVHSPFVYNLLTKSVYSKVDEPVFEKLESIRTRLLSDDREITVTDYGAGSTYDGKNKKRKISTITRNFAKDKNFCRLLFRLTNYFKPQTIIELGTSVGISAMYQSAGCDSAKCYTFEGCPETANVAREVFNKNNFNNITCITGNFDESLPEFLEKLKNIDYLFIDGNHTYEATLRYFNLAKKYRYKDTIIVFDDINWSGGMRKAWEEIKSDNEVTITVDFYFVGLVSFNTDFTKQDFKKRL